MAQGVSDLVGSSWVAESKLNGGTGEDHPVLESLFLLEASNIGCSSL